MDRLAADQNQTITFELISKQGNPIEGVSYTFDVLDEDGAVLQGGSGAVPSKTDTEVSVVIGGSVNTIPEGQINAARTIALRVTDAAGVTHQLSQTYLLEGGVALPVPARSGMTLTRAAVVAATAVQDGMKEAWDYAEDYEREAGLITAWDRLCAVNLKVFRRGETPPEELRDFVQGKVRINELTPEQFALLPDQFVRAARTAQLIEACYVMGGDPTQERRDDGLISKTVGESSEMFRSKPQIRGQLCPKAMRFLAPYVDNTVRIGRG